MHLLLARVALTVALAGLFWLADSQPAAAFAEFNSGSNVIEDKSFEFFMVKVNTPAGVVPQPQTSLTVNGTTGTTVVGAESPLQNPAICATEPLNPACTFQAAFEGQGLRIDSDTGTGGQIDLSTFEFIPGTGSIVTINGGAILNDVDSTGLDFADAILAGGGSTITLNGGEIGRSTPAETGDVTLLDSSRFVVNAGIVWGDVSAASFAQVVFNGGEIRGDLDLAATDRTLLTGEAQLVIDGGLLNDVQLSEQATMVMRDGVILDDFTLVGGARADVFGGEIRGSDATPVTSQPTLDVQGGALLVLYGDNFVLDGMPIVFTDTCPEGACSEIGFFTLEASPLTIDVDGDSQPDLHGLAGHLTGSLLPFAPLTLEVGDPIGDTARIRLVQAAVIPEPATVLLLMGGLAGLAAARRRKA